MFSNTLKSRKLNFCQWKPEHNSPVSLLVTMLVHEWEVDCNVKKVGHFSSCMSCLVKISKKIIMVYSFFDNSPYIFLLSWCDSSILCMKRGN